MRKKGITGIEIKPDFNDFPGLIRYNTYLVVKPENDNNFISLEGIVKNRRLKHLNEEEMGRVSFDVHDYLSGEGDKRKVRLHESSYQPFSAAPIPKYGCFLGKGIADKIDLWVVNHLLGLFDEQSAVHFDRETDPSNNQLKRCGIDASRDYSLREYYDILREIVGK